MVTLGEYLSHIGPAPNHSETADQALADLAFDPFIGLRPLEEYISEIVPPEELIPTEEVNTDDSPLNIPALYLCKDVVKVAEAFPRLSSQYHQGQNGESDRYAKFIERLRNRGFSSVTVCVPDFGAIAKVILENPEQPGALVKCSRTTSNQSGGDIFQFRNFIYY